MAVWNNVCKKPYMYCICAMYDNVCGGTVKTDTDKIVQSESTRPTGQFVPKWRRINVDATSSRRIDVNTTSFYVLAGPFYA